MNERLNSDSYTNYHMAIYATLCIIKNNDQILLQLKSEGRFGAGKWNGTGGKVNPDETPFNAAVREVEEETGLKVTGLKLHGVLQHYFGTEDTNPWIVYVYSTSTYQGTPRSSPEGKLKWFTKENIPYEQMWQDDKYWIPLLLADLEFTGEFHFNTEGSKLLKHQLVIKD